jgi:predicted dinucleotide-binding enzyme
MNIGIIGSGKMGSGLGTIWARHGNNVIFSYSRDPEKLKSLAAASKARAGSPEEAVKASDVILLSPRWSTVDDALQAAGPMQGKIVIDCTNPLTGNADALVVGHSTSAAEILAQRLPGAKVVKAFNTVFAEVYHSDTRLFGSRRATMFFCGDDPEAKSVVSKLILQIGLDPVDAGPLTSARHLEALAMLMITLGYGMNMGTNIALSLIHR